MAALLVATAACDSTPNDQGAAPTAESADESPANGAAGVRMPPLWSADHLAAQPRLDDLAQRIPSDLGWEPASTSWTAARRDVPEALQTEGAESPGALLYRLAEAWDWAASLGLDVWEHTLRIHQDDDAHASGVVLAWGLQDDSLAGSDLRVEMHSEDGMWWIVAVEERYHCARGVTADDLCR
jgi:hypothetical protein